MQDPPLAPLGGPAHPGALHGDHTPAAASVGAGTSRTPPAGQIPAWNLLTALTLLLGFIVMNWQQAASELQQVQAEAPIVGSTLTGFAVGLVLWLIYALGFGALRADWQRARTGRRIGGLLR